MSETAADSWEACYSAALFVLQPPEAAPRVSAAVSELLAALRRLPPATARSLAYECLLREGDDAAAG